MRAIYFAAGLAASTSCALDTAVPAPEPATDVQVTSAGIVGLAIDDDAAVTALHVRVAIDNRRDAVPAVFDGSAVRVDDSTAPILANAELATLPIAIVDRGEHATVDLYFPIARDARDVEVLVPGFASGRPVGKRVRLVASDAAPTIALGTAKRWWSAPSYAWPAFRHQDGIITPRPPVRARIAHAPARGFVAVE